ncbi:uncharacterized protein KY384_006347 [Bacidia gigantensis]|uniref:uncharacterized protein n=1 Tax=Bacidia gigantensis TaxID=2732470 RepID=UPI001D03C9AF|nr:uncharacterized protein KY384_006347 [Bacidia gigantensis]KAG8528660.1 hypothetical protein KY384_006347 [Bacidia gigantensis]
MLSKDVATVRLSNLARTTQIVDIFRFFEARGLKQTLRSSLCTSTAARDANLVATVTFETPADAKKALSCDGESLGGKSIRVDRDFYGLTTISSPATHALDIIAVHGLNGHGYGTWTSAREGKGGQEFMWLRDLLPNELQSCRIGIYGYNSTLLGSNTSVSTVQDFARDLLQRILIYTEECYTHTVANTDQQIYGRVINSVQAILFLATPHRGSHTAKAGALLSNVAKIAFQKPPTQLLNALEYDSEIVTKLTGEFRAIQSRFEIVNFYERRKTSMKIVDEDSSCLEMPNEVLVPIDATHSQICKFRGPSDPNFTIVLGHLKRSVRLSEKRAIKSQSSTGRLESIDRERTSDKAQHFARPSILHDGRRNAIIQQKLWRCGIFDVPHAKNPNFRGRESELERLDSLLKNGSNTTSGSAKTVAIYGLGGVGKTQLAIQYVHKARAESAELSIFWISARGNEEIAAGLLSVFQLLNKTIAGSTEDETSYDAKSARPFLSSHENTEEQNRAKLKEWMCLKSSGDWLMVFDNFDDLKINFHHHIPREATGRVIFTTRDRNIIGLSASAGIDLRAMDYQNARMLFLSLSNPFVEPTFDTLLEDRENEALDQILDDLQYFPLAIDQAACFVRENAPMSLQEYCRYLQPRSENREQLLRFKQANPDYPESVMTTWEISLDYLNRVRPQASQILQLLGFLNNEVSEVLLTNALCQIPWELKLKLGAKQLPADIITELTYLKDDVKFRIAIGTLASLSLVQRSVERGTLTVHPLVHEWIRVRLNPFPEQQKTLTTSACHILFHHFPGELVMNFGDTSYRVQLSEQNRLRADCVKSHLPSTLMNIREYGIGSRGLECYLLCETWFLGCQKDSPGYRIPACSITKDVLQTLASAIRSIIPQLPVECREIAKLIHYSSFVDGHGYLEDMQHNRGIILETLTNLQTLQFSLPTSDSISTLLMLLMTVTFDLADRFADWVQTHQLQAPSHISAEAVKNHHGDEFMRDLGSISQTKSRLFTALWAIPSQSLQIPITAPLGPLLEFLILRQMVLNATPQRFKVLSEFNMKQLLDRASLAFLSVQQQGDYLSLIAKRFWEIDGPKDFDRIKCLFQITRQLWKSLLDEREQEEGRDRWQQIWSETFYLGNSFGRESGVTHFATPSGRTYTTHTESTDLVEPIDYIWSIVLEVSIDITSPRLPWIARRDSHQCIETLALSERTWGAEIAMDLKNLYHKVRKRPPYHRNYMDGTSFELASLTMSMNLQEWKKALHEASRLLQCFAAEDVCDKAQAVPWLPPTVPYEAEDVRVHSSTTLNQVDTVLSDPTHGEWHTSMKNHVQSTNTAVKKLDRWMVPTNYEAVFDTRYNDAIAASISLLLFLGHISDKENDLANMKLDRVRYLGRCDAGHLGRLALIYWLAQKWPDAGSGAMGAESMMTKKTDMETTPRTRRLSLSNEFDRGLKF